ncbi:MAG: hypothetical protein GY754_43540 [bacterium]|nr:hypothetical protein [bacterium]
MFRIGTNGIVQGENGICYSYSYPGKPQIPVKIKSDREGVWNEAEFILDTGADGSYLHPSEAEMLGLNINNFTDVGIAKGAARTDIRIHYRSNVQVQIGDFPPFFLKIGLLPKIEGRKKTKGLRILGRNTILALFGIAIDTYHIGIFPKLDI